jgi:hypothetical protein
MIETASLNTLKSRVYLLQIPEKLRWNVNKLRFVDFMVETMHCKSDSNIRDS